MGAVSHSHKILHGALCLPSSFSPGLRHLRILGKTVLFSAKVPLGGSDVYLHVLMAIAGFL